MIINQFPARFGKYILLDRINAGGMAEVFRAKQIGAEQFERLVAIKCMLPQLAQDAHFITMFIDEAKLASRLVHANIIQIHELGKLGERLYIAMELVNGRDLRHILRNAKTSLTPIPVGFAAYVIAKAAEGLDFAHRKASVDGTPLNLVHRDVSPQNILVSYDGEVKVVDFGIAKAEARATETQAGVLKGKFAYMAPEQVMGEAIDRRADIFALGSVLYEVITGQRLFTGDNDLSILERVRAAKLPDLQAVLPEGGEELEHVLLRALARKPEDRYSWASEMAEDLEHLLIEDRSIFGHKRAAQFMGTLYADEVAAWTDHEKRYAEVTVASCVVAIDEEKPAAVFRAESEPSDTPLPSDPSDTPRESPAQQREIMRRRARLAAAGQGARGNPARRIASTGSQTLIEQNPTNSHTSRVLRKLRVAFVVAAMVVTALLSMVYVRLQQGGGRGADAFEGLRAVLPSGAKAALPRIFEHLLPAPPTPPTPQPSPAPTPSEPDENAEEDARGRFGYVLIRGAAGERGRVLIDGKDMGVLPLSGAKRLRVGSHELRVVDETSGRLTKPATPFVVTPRHSRRSPKILGS